MYATIIQQSTPSGIQQVVIAPLPDGSVKQFTRTAKGQRGSAGAWQEVVLPPVFYAPEHICPTAGKAVGAPRSIQLSDKQKTFLQYPITPTEVVQKLGKLVADENTASARDFEELYVEVLSKAVNNPIALATYVAEPAPEPVFKPVSLTAVAEQFFPVGVPAEPVYPTVGAFTDEPQPAEFVPEPVAEPMSYGTVAPSISDSHAVLTVPSIEPYFSRKFFGKTEDEVYDICRAEGWPVLLTGEAGTGKTSSGRNYAAQRGLPFVTIECTQQIDQSNTQGRFVPTGVGNSVIWKYSQLATAIQQPSVILINEMTRMPAKAAGLFLRLLAEGELLIEPLNEVIKVHPGVLFIADQNTGLGYTGTSKQDAALVDRFDVKLEFHYDTSIEANFIKSPTLLTFASNIREASDLNDEFSVPMSTRILKNFVAQAPSLNFEFAVNSLLSNYPKIDGEREAIKMRFDADASAIADELGVSLGKYSTN